MSRASMNTVGPGILQKDDTALPSRYTVIDALLCSTIDVESLNSMLASTFP